MNATEKAITKFMRQTLMLWLSGLAELAAQCLATEKLFRPLPFSDWFPPPPPPPPCAIKSCRWAESLATWSPAPTNPWNNQLKYLGWQEMWMARALKAWGINLVLASKYWLVWWGFVCCWSQVRFKCCLPVFLALPYSGFVKPSWSWVSKPLLLRPD